MTTQMNGRDLLGCSEQEGVELMPQYDGEVVVRDRQRAVIGHELVTIAELQGECVAWNHDRLE
jgi:hypothetical protein